MLLVPGPEITAISSESIGGTALGLISVDGPGSGVVLRAPPAPSASCKACANFAAMEAADSACRLAKATSGGTSVRSEGLCVLVCLEWARFFRGIS